MQYMLKKIISGGQNGADLAGLLAAKEAGIPTGGVMPLGFRTLDGNKPEYASLYGITEHPSYHYQGRTYENVRDSDGTIRFAHNFQSLGELCTFHAIKQYNKPYFDVTVVDPLVFSVHKTYCPKRVAEWIKANDIHILNVAGNSNKTCPGIENFVKRFLLNMFSLL